MNIESVSVLEGEEDELPLMQAPEDERALDEADGARKGPALPADFPANAQFVADGSGAVLLTLEWPKTLEYKDAQGKVTKSETLDKLLLKRLNGEGIDLVLKATREGGSELMKPQVLAVMTGMTLPRAKLLVRKMDAADIYAFLAVYRFFTMPGRRTGP